MATAGEETEAAAMMIPHLPHRHQPLHQMKIQATIRLRHLI